MNIFVEQLDPAISSTLGTLLTVCTPAFWKAGKRRESRRHAPSFEGHNPKAVHVTSAYIPLGKT